MPRLYLIAILLCIQQLLPILANPAGEDGEWIDDVSNNPEVMGLLNTDSSDDDQSSPVQSAPVTRTLSDPETGEWVDDVTGNLLVMGEDPLSRGNIDDMNSNDNRKKREAGKKISKALKKALKKGKREINLVAESPILEREKRGAAKKILKALKKAMKH